MTYENGKKFIRYAFLALLALQFIFFINNICGILFGRTFLPQITNLLSVLLYLFASIGFFILWQTKKDILDAAVAGALILSLIIDFFWDRLLYRIDNYKTYTIVSLLFTLIACAYLAIWAFKMFKAGNVFAAGLLGAAFLYRSLNSIFYSIVVVKIFNFGTLGLFIYYLGFLVAAAIPAFVAVTDKE